MIEPTLNITPFGTPLVDLSRSASLGPGPSTPEGSLSSTSESVSSESHGQPAADDASDASEPSSTASHQTAESPATKSAAAGIQLVPTNLELYDVSATRRIQFLPTNTILYDAWSSVYDHDGNILQRVDDLELSTLLPIFLALLRPRLSSPPDSQGASSSLSLIDLGCGTGRNTLKLMTHPWPPQVAVSITGLDASPKMLEIADQKLKACSDGLQRDGQAISYRLVLHNLLDPAATTSRHALSTAGSLDEGSEADAVVSTLVLEHFPLNSFFRVLRSLLKLSGVALVTNSHPDMATLSQAGFF